MAKSQKSLKIKLDDIIVNPKNTKLHDKQQIDEIRKSISDFGYVQSIVIGDDNMCRIGHGRLQALKQLRDMGERGKDVEVLQLSGYTKKELKKLSILDNKTNQMTGFDIENLKLELNELQDVELNELFLDMEELQELQDLQTDDQKAKEEIEDIVPEHKAKGIIKRGDVVEMGMHRLSCGDSTSKEDVERLMNGQKADMVFTDPPYGMSYEGCVNESGVKTSHNHAKIKNDELKGQKQM